MSGRDDTSKYKSDLICMLQKCVYPAIKNKEKLFLLKTSTTNNNRLIVLNITK